MRKIVGKFKLSIANQQTIDLPHGARILSVKEQDDTLCLWAIFDKTRSTYKQYIFIRGIGHSADWLERLKFLDTIIMKNGLVWHVFYTDMNEVK